MSNVLESVLLVKEVSKRFGKVRAVDGVTISVNAGEIYALIGPNGSGKTTLVKMITGLLRADKGVIKIGGIEVDKDSLKTKEQLGYLPDDPSPYDYLTGREFLELTGRLKGLSETQVKERVSQLEPIFPLSQILDQAMGQYSRGNKQKVAFLAALISNPKLLIIDEPIVGLDPTSIKIFGEELKEFAKNGGAVLMTTHILDFAKTWADRVGLLDRGELMKEIRINKDTDLETLYQLVEPK